MISLPKAAPAYDQRNEEEARQALRLADTQNLKTGQNIYIIRNELIVVSPGGVAWAIKVDDAGAVTTEQRQLRNA